jgi:SAM-dependent methyltransferase
MFGIITRLRRLLERPVEVAPEPSTAELTHRETSLSGWFNPETDELYKGFAVSAQDSVLDIGCGDGGYIRFCARRGAEVIFADVNAEKIASVERLLQDSPARNVMGLVTDANPLPLPDSRVNKIVAMEVLEHVEDPAQFMSELVRVGQPGAQYLITVPDPLGETVQKDLAPPVYFEHPNHIRIFSREDFEKLVVDAGLIVEHRAYYGFFWSVWWFFFWSCKHDLSEPWHPLLKSWAHTWNQLLELPDGPRVKEAMDKAMPKSQVILARKPY